MFRNGGWRGFESVPSPHNHRQPPLVTQQQPPSSPPSMPLVNYRHCLVVPNGYCNDRKTLTPRQSVTRASCMHPCSVRPCHDDARDSPRATFVIGVVAVSLGSAALVGASPRREAFSTGCVSLVAGAIARD
jgi:hypothetical protein